MKLKVKHLATQSWITKFSYHTNEISETICPLYKIWLLQDVENSKTYIENFENTLIFARFGTKRCAQGATNAQYCKGAQK